MRRRIRDDVANKSAWTGNGISNRDPAVQHMAFEESDDRFDDRSIARGLNQLAVEALEIRIINLPPTVLSSSRATLAREEGSHPIPRGFPGIIFGRRG